MHGDTELRTLTIRVKDQPVAQMFRNADLDAEQLLRNILKAWKNAPENGNVGWVKVYYGDIHLATARTKFGRRDVVEWK